jgi:hypothetical protein
MLKNYNRNLDHVYKNFQIKKSIFKASILHIKNNYNKIFEI